MRRTDDTTAKHRAILETAARLICKKGYEGTSIQEIADACGLTKAGLYHHIESKEQLHVEIMNYGMDVFEERVLSEVEHIPDPVERLKACMATLHGQARAQINARKKRYVRFLESSFAEAVEKGMIRPVDPTVAAFSFLGMVLWIYKWFKPGGKRADDEVAAGMVDLLFTGLVPAPRS